MAWVRIDDHFYDHPKWRDAPCDSIALWVAAIAWCNRNDEHDGYIPTVKAQGLVSVRNFKRTAADLIARRAWVPHERGFLIHEYAEWQQNERIREIRQKRIEAGRKGGLAKAANRAANDLANASDDAMALALPHQPPPLSLVSSENNSHLTDDGGGVAFASQDERRRLVADEYARQGLMAKQNNGGRVSSPEAYMRPMRERAMANPELTKLLRKYPSAPAGVLAAALNGETQSLRYQEAVE